MYNPCPLLDNFIEYGRKKEEKKEKQQFLMFLDDKSGNKDEDEEVMTIGSALPVTPTRSETVQIPQYNTAGSAMRATSVNEEERLSGRGSKAFISQSDGGNHMEDQR